MLQDTNASGFSRLPLAPNVFDDTPPPLPCPSENGTAQDADTVPVIVTMRARPARLSRRASTSWSPAGASPARSRSRSRSRPPSDANLATVQVRQGVARATLGSTPDGEAVLLPSVIIDGKPYRGSLADAWDTPVHGYSPIRLDDPVPWNAELGAIDDDDDYWKPQCESKLAPGVRGGWDFAKAASTSSRSSTRFSIAMEEILSRRPRSADAGALSPTPEAGASPAHAHEQGAQRQDPGVQSIHSGAGNSHMQIFVFGGLSGPDSATDGRSTDGPSTFTRVASRAWRLLASTSRALTAMCEEWLRRLAAWVSQRH
ncbi:hypothetical protein [Achromobacter aloeverae]|uniref:hypothetical protein n=1 Tax=Achromobacter aloeverae TaxID=1750518 RepID=UPI00100E7022|nr:hypothetical protein [Achromobacter aloeverae]